VQYRRSVHRPAVVLGGGGPPHFWCQRSRATQLNAELWRD